jgi:energy-coupling factor transporter ATP-binding protein EcfA2
MSDQSTPGFTSTLLQEPIAVRRRYFETKVVAHQRLKEVYETVLHAIRYPAGTSLIFVTGPTGVGKTTLMARIVKQLIEDASNDPDTTAGHIPVVAMEAPSPDSGNFSWKDYFTRALIVLDEPMMDSKITSVIRGIHRDDQGQLVIERNVTTPDLRRVLEKCFHHRRTRAFIVDEGQHLKKMASGRRLLDQMDTLKSLANMTETVHVLIGHYDLLGLMDLSAQLSRRSVEIHFPRYHLTQAEDLKEFKKLLRTFQRHLPLVKEPDLQNHVEYFYEQSLGCTGMLKTMLNKALGAALEQGEQTMTAKHWERYAEPASKRKEMLHEIIRGEQRIKERAEERHRDELRAMLGLAQAEPTPSLPQAHPKLSPTQTEASPKRRSVGRVGQRKATRDAVGKEADNANFH